MPTTELEERVTRLEGEVAELKDRLARTDGAAQPWWERIYGVFANDPLFEEAVRLGRQYREAQPYAEDEPTGE